MIFDCNDKAKQLFIGQGQINELLTLKCFNFVPNNG